jgi:hypothetical protein
MKGTQSRMEREEAPTVLAIEAEHQGTLPDVQSTLESRKD